VTLTDAATALLADAFPCAELGRDWYEIDASLVDALRAATSPASKDPPEVREERLQALGFEPPDEEQVARNRFQHDSAHVLGAPGRK